MVVFLAPRPEEQIAGHSQVDEQGLAGLQVQEEVLGAAPGADEKIAGQGPEAGGGQLLAQAFAAGPDAGDPPAHEMALHDPAHGFYFG